MITNIIVLDYVYNIMHISTRTIIIAIHSLVDFDHIYINANLIEIVLLMTQYQSSYNF